MEEKLENEQENKIIEIKYVYLSRSESLKKAQRKYRVNNREKMNEYSKKYYDKIKCNEDFKKKQSEQKKEYYQRKKQNCCPLPTSSAEIRI